MIKPTLNISANHIGIGYEHRAKYTYSFCWHMLIELRWRDAVNGRYFPRINLNRHEWRCS